MAEVWSRFEQSAIENLARLIIDDDYEVVTSDSRTLTTWRARFGCVESSRCKDNIDLLITVYDISAH